MTDDEAALALGRRLAEFEPQVARAAMRQMFGPHLGQMMCDPDERLARQAWDLAASLGLIDTSLN